MLLFLFPFGILFQMKYKINKNLLFQKINEKLIGFNVEKSIIYTFNETAEFIVKKLRSGCEETEIVLPMAKKYSIESKIIEKDVKKIITDMIENKILIRI